MAFQLKIVAAVLILIYFLILFHLVRKETLALKYTLVWIVGGCAMAAFVVFPQFFMYLASCLGIEVASNGIFAVCIIFIFELLMSFTAIVSTQSLQIKRLIQTAALQQKELEEMKEKLARSEVLHHSDDA